MDGFESKVLDKLGEISERTISNQERLNAFERSMTETNQTLVRFAEQTHNLACPCRVEAEDLFNDAPAVRSPINIVAKEDDGVSGVRNTQDRPQQSGEKA